MNNRLMTDTKTVKINDAEFTLRIISKRKWFPIQGKEQDFFSFTFKKSAQGIPPEESKTKTIAEMMNMILSGMSQKERLQTEQDLFDNHWAMIKMGVVDHKGIKDASNNDIPVKRDPDGLISDETIDVYFDRGYFTQLFSEIYGYQNLSEDDRKN